MITKRQAGCPCCGGVDRCITTLTVCVTCGITPQPGVPVAVYRDGVLIDSCETSESGCCTIQIEGRAPVAVHVGGAVVPFTPDCGPVAIHVVGKTCAECVADGPDEITLGTPYGDVTLSKGTFGYFGLGTIPGVPDVTRLFCFGGTGGDACGENTQVFDLPVLYSLDCDVFDGTILRLSAVASACDRGELASPRFVKAVCFDGSPVNETGTVSLIFFNAAAGYAEDVVSVGNCVPCGESLEFALDLADFGKPVGLFTVAGGLAP